jgi:hypothetical protein
MAERKQAEKNLPGTGTLWLGWFIGIIAWGIHLFASYTLVEWYCNNSEVLQSSTVKLVLHGISIFTLVMAGYGVIFTWRLWRRWRTDSSTSLGRIAFMARSGLLMNIFMVAIIAVEGIPNFFVYPVCLA